MPVHCFAFGQWLHLSSASYGLRAGDQSSPSLPGLSGPWKFRNDIPPALPSVSIGSPRSFISPSTKATCVRYFIAELTTRSVMFPLPLPPPPLAPPLPFVSEGLLRP